MRQHRSLAAAAAALSTLAGAGAARADASQDFVNAVKSNCWSCTFYENVMNASNNLFGAMFQYFVGSASFMGLVFAMLGIVLVWRVMRIFGFGIVSEHQMHRDWDGVFGYGARCAVVFGLFLTTAAAQGITTGSSGSTINPVRDLFLDGPLAVGTGVGCYLANATMQTSAMGSSSLFGPAMTAGVGCTDAIDPSNWLGSHISAAKAILAGFHNMGVGGMAVGVETMTYGATTVSFTGLGRTIVLVLTGMILVATFLMFTVTFGLRYVDAALRAMIALAFAPVFMVFWIFDRTRPMAHAALRSVLFMATLFAASGLVLGMATSVMTFGIQTAFGVSSMDPGLLATKSIIHISSGGSSSNINYYSLMMLLGCWGISVGLAGSAFRVAEELVSFEGSSHVGEMGVGTQAAGQVSDVAGMGVDVGSKIGSAGKSGVFGIIGGLRG